jgi:3-hydroxyisobutyrate dehydrogenase-like beta-hydroxyacid dehydrogenase
MTASSPAVIGFIGVGRMGGPMAQRLLEAGHALVVFDTQEAALAPLLARGAERAASPADVAARADHVLASLPTPKIVTEAVLGAAGIIQGARMKLFVDLSTSGPAAAAALSTALAARGVASLDAPVSGGVTGARSGKLSLMVSGPRSAFDQVEPVLKNFGRLFYVGEQAGLGQTLKLANNLMSAAAIAITAEAITMGVKAGLDPKVMLDVFNASSGRNTATEDKYPRCVITRRFDFGFTTGLSFKDVRLCVEEAEALGVPMVVGSAVRQMLSITQNQFGADSDCTCIARTVEQWAGCEIGSANSNETKG